VTDSVKSVNVSPVGLRSARAKQVYVRKYENKRERLSQRVNVNE
jgi:hypothetical protein